MRVPGAVALREELAYHGFMSEGREGDRGNKLLSGRSDDHLNLSAPLDESSYNQACFIGCNRACDAQYDFLSF